ncbi:hypothetical protein M5K25_008691 [Dendrobium thyrsiflorum]|uniref:Uncharacterized protein n=1 Tax=Dendrobium thyrsiflorum TaxID=117978 RepID=A0ABD0V906_DENTH
MAAPTFAVDSAATSKWSALQRHALCLQASLCHDLSRLDAKIVISVLQHSKVSSLAALHLNFFLFLWAALVDSSETILGLSSSICILFHSEFATFMKLQVQVLSMSTVDLASALAQIIADTSLQLIKLQEDAGEIRGTKLQMWWEMKSNEKNELQVKKLMEENIESATQFLKLKAFYIMPIPFANTIFCSHNQSSDSYNLKPFEPQAPS